MKMYILKSPERNVDSLLNAIKASGNTPITQKTVWSSDLSTQETDKILEEDYDLAFARLLMDWREIQNAEWSVDLGHHKIYQAEAALTGQQDEWICVMEDDVELLPQFFSRISELNELHFNTPTVIQLFSRGKRYCRLSPGASAQHPTLFEADFPPGSTCLYLINRRAISLATREHKARGWADWPLWSQECRFLFSYPWVGIEYPTNSLLPVQTRSRFAYYIWRLRVLLHLDYKKWKSQGYVHSQYFFFLIKPWLLRILLVIGLYKPLNSNDPNSIWVRKSKHTL